MADDPLKRLRERLDPANAEELARLCYEAGNPRPLPWEQLPLDRRDSMTDAMRTLLEHILLESPHLWMIRQSLVVCERCGVVRRRKGRNPACPGTLPR
jgi:hypothetical protein